MLSTSEKLKRRLGRIAPLELFTMDEIIKNNDSPVAVNKEINRMVNRGELGRLENGVYFIPRQSRFGIIKPTSVEITRFLTRRRDKITGYVSGPAVYNRLGLTTQIPAAITIATPENKRSGEFANLKVRYIKSYGEIKEENIPILQILDTINGIKKVPDSDINQNLKRLMVIISRLTYKEQLVLICQAKYYPPMVRALTGLLLNNIWLKKPGYLSRLNSLKNSLRTTKFHFNTDIDLVKKEEWRIKVRLF